ncbi:hypothetical protein QE152_g6714 [Popillia japonica]|uniref:Uncharacterized protein n=1 Tax=Popillia japonica TaxID=7064 RepID=A0AAW1MGC2_POPJA
MDFPLDLRLTGGLTLHELLTEIENNAEDIALADSGIDIVLIPPNNACDDQTDVDSGDEELVSINNLPAAQLNAAAELHLSDNNESSDPEDNIP